MELDKFKVRLRELESAGGVGWYPEDLIFQVPDLDHHDDDGEHTDHSHADHTGEPKFTFPISELPRIFFYEPGYLLVGSEVRQSVDNLLNLWGHADTSGTDGGSAWGFDRVRVNITGTTVPELALRLAKALEFAYPGHNLVAPNHILTAGKAHAGGSVDDPNDRDKDGLPLRPLEAPSGSAGAGTTIAVIDSGILPDTELPDWMRTNVFTYSDHDIEDDWFDLVNGKRNIRFPAVHGTFVASIIRQVAPGARILVKRALNRLGHVTDFDFGRAIEEVLHSPYGVPDVINCSLGCPSWRQAPPPVLDAAIKSVLTHPNNIVVVAAAGNAGKRIENWPAANKATPVVGVGSVAMDAAPSDFTNFGPSVDVWAVGEDVTGVFAHGVYYRLAAGIADPREFEGVACWRGTSFAAPRVSALVAAAIKTDAGAVTPRVALKNVLDSGIPVAPDDLTHRIPLVTSGLPANTVKSVLAAVAARDAAGKVGSGGGGAGGGAAHEAHQGGHHQNGGADHHRQDPVAERQPHR